MVNSQNLNFIPEILGEVMAWAGAWVGRHPLLVTLVALGGLAAAKLWRNKRAQAVKAVQG